MPRTLRHAAALIVVFSSVGLTLPARAQSNGSLEIFYVDPVTGMCVSGGSFLINPSNDSCVVAVESATWTTIKTLYR